MCTVLAEFNPASLHFKRCFCDVESGLHSVDGRAEIICPSLKQSLSRCTKPKWYWFIDLWCVGTSICKRQEMTYNNMGCHTEQLSRTMSNEYQSISEEPSQVCSSNKFTIRPTELNCSWCFTQKTKNMCLLASGGPEDNMQRSWFKKLVCFRNTFPNWKVHDLFQQNEFLWWSNISCMWKSQWAQLSCMEKWKSIWHYWTWVCFTGSKCMVCSDEKQCYQSFLFWRTYSNRWHFSGYVISL